jgi:hypothetical protein
MPPVSAPELRRLQEAQAKGAAVVNGHELPAQKKGFSMSWIKDFLPQPKATEHTVKWVEEGDDE